MVGSDATTLHRELTPTTNLVCQTGVSTKLDKVPHKPSVLASRGFNEGCCAVPMDTVSTVNRCAMLEPHQHLVIVVHTDALKQLCVQQRCRVTHPDGVRVVHLLGHALLEPLQIKACDGTTIVIITHTRIHVKHTAQADDRVNVQLQQALHSNETLCCMDPW